MKEKKFLVKILALSFALFISEYVLASISKMEVHGHRGARAEYPENSLKAFKYALDNHIDVLEMDVVLTKDNVFVVHHDAFLDPQFCQKEQNGEFVDFKKAVDISSLNYTELQSYRCGTRVNSEFPHQRLSRGGERIEGLEGLLHFIQKYSELSPYEYKLNIEIKVYDDKFLRNKDRNIQNLCKVLKDNKLEKRTIIQSFNLDVLKRVKELYPNAVTSLLVRGRERFFKKLFNSNGYLGMALDGRVDILSPHFQLISKNEVKELQENNIRVVPWTVNDKSDWKKMLSWGVDGLITDDPVSLKNWIQEH